MDKNKKLDEIIEELQKEGLSIGELKTYWKKTQKTREKESQNSLSEDQKISPGMYIYADGTVSFKYRKGDKIKAIVGAVEAERCIAICPHEYSCSLDNALDVRKFCKICGMSPEEVFLPSETEMRQILSNAPAINKAIQQVVSETDFQIAHVYESHGVIDFSSDLSFIESHHTDNASMVRLGYIFFYYPLSNSYYWTSTEATEKGLGIAIADGAGKRLMVKSIQHAQVRLCTYFEIKEDVTESK